MNLVDPDGRVPHVVIGAVVGALVSGGIALYEGKSGIELWGAVAGGTVGGALAAATAGASLSMGGGVLASSTWGVVISEAAGGLIGGAAQSVTEQAISTGSVDATEVAIDSSVGFVAGAVLGKAKTAIERVGKSILGKIETKYASPSVKATMEKEVTKEFKTLGKPLGHSGRARAKKEAASRIKNFVEVESSTEGAAEETAKKGTEIIIKIGEYEVEEWLNK